MDEPGAADLSQGLGHRVAPGLVYAGQAGATRVRSGRRSSDTLWTRLARRHARGHAESSTGVRATSAAARGATPSGAGHDGSVSVSRGFRPKHFRWPTEDERHRVPPGQRVARGFPVLTAGAVPQVPDGGWRFEVVPVDPTADVVGWTLDELRRLPSETVTRDIHCVTRWSKLDTTWEGVPVDVLLDAVPEAGARVVEAWCWGGYTTNLPLDDVTGGKAWVVWSYDGQPLTPEHGGPLRLLVPHLYFWKSAKWLRALRLLPEDAPGFWETAGYHNRGDPWREQRRAGD